MRRLTITGLLWAVACSGGSGPPVGPPPPQVASTRTVQGHIGYQLRIAGLSNRDGNGRLLAQPGLSATGNTTDVSNIQIELLGDDGRVVATTTSAQDGRYSVIANFGFNPPTPVHVRVTASIQLPFGTTVRVFPDANALVPYTFTTGPLGVPGTARNTVMTANADILLDDGAGAYHMLNVLYNGFLIGRTGLKAGTRPPDMNILWKPGNGDQSTLVPAVDFATLTVAGGIAGDDTSNTDVWDNAVLMRLHGQYMLDYYLWEVAPEGTISDCPLVPSAAWKEGFLDFWSCLGRNSRVYWDTVGSGASARVVRYFDIESFFDDSLARLGPDDPNVYQPATLVGINSRYSIAELLWDIHDDDKGSTENDTTALDPRITIQILDAIPAGVSYPYVFTLLRGYESTLTMTDNAIKGLTRDPEDQGFDYPESVEAGTFWPTPISPDGKPGFSIRAPFEKTVSDKVDTTGPAHTADSIADAAQRYFKMDLLLPSNVALTLTTAGDLVIDLLTQANALVASGVSPLTLENLQPNSYVLRVRAADGAAAQSAEFDLKVEVSEP